MNGHELSDGISQLDASVRKLAIPKGATRLIQDLGPRKVWNFED